MRIRGSHRFEILDYFREFKHVQAPHPQVLRIEMAADEIQIELDLTHPLADLYMSNAPVELLEGECPRLNCLEVCYTGFLPPNWGPLRNLTELWFNSTKYVWPSIALGDLAGMLPTTQSLGYLLLDGVTIDATSVIQTGQMIDLPCLHTLEIHTRGRSNAIMMTIFMKHFSAPDLLELFVGNAEDEDFESLADESRHSIPRFSLLMTLGFSEVDLQDSSTALQLFRHFPNSNHIAIVSLALKRRCNYRLSSRRCDR